MGLPTRAFMTLAEAASRWNCLPADIPGWASLGKIEIVTGIAPVHCGTEVISGLVVVSAPEILPMFRRCGTGPVQTKVRRFRPLEEKDWRVVTDPPKGVTVALADLVILTSEAQRFEAENELFRTTRAGQGPERKYDWDGFFAELIKRVHFHGLPDKQGDLVEEMKEWFGRRSETGDTPDDSTIRKRIAPVWRMLREDA